MAASEALMLNLSVFRTPEGSWHYRGFAIQVDPEGRYYLERERGVRLPLMARHASLEEAVSEVDTIFEGRSNLDPVEWSAALFSPAGLARLA